MSQRPNELSFCEWGVCATVHRRCQRPSEGLGTNKTVKETWRRSTHVNTERICPGEENEFRIESNDFGFICAGVSSRWEVIIETHNIFHLS